MAYYPQRIGEPECRDFLRTGRCKYGESCKYHHPIGGVQASNDPTEPPFPLRPNEPPCQYFLKHGTCKFGHTCKFNHPPHLLELFANGINNTENNLHHSSIINVSSHSMNQPPHNTIMPSSFESALSNNSNPDTHYSRSMPPSQLLPQRPTEPDCIYYMRNGRCKYGSTCKYNHPYNIHSTESPNRMQSQLSPQARLLHASSSSSIPRGRSTSDGSLVEMLGGFPNTQKQQQQQLQAKQQSQHLPPQHHPNDPNTARIIFPDGSVSLLQLNQNVNGRSPFLSIHPSAGASTPRSMGSSSTMHYHTEAMNDSSNNNNNKYKSNHGVVSRGSATTAGGDKGSPATASSYHSTISNVDYLPAAATLPPHQSPMTNTNPVRSIYQSQHHEGQPQQQMLYKTPSSSSTELHTSGSFHRMNPSNDRSSVPLGHPNLVHRGNIPPSRGNGSLHHHATTIEDMHHGWSSNTSLSTASQGSDRLSYHEDMTTQKNLHSSVRPNNNPTTTTNNNNGNTMNTPRRGSHGGVPLYSHDGPKNIPSSNLNSSDKDSNGDDDDGLTMMTSALLTMLDTNDETNKNNKSFEDFVLSSFDNDHFPSLRGQNDSSFAYGSLNPNNSYRTSFSSHEGPITSSSSKADNTNDSSLQRHPKQPSSHITTSKNKPMDILSLGDGEISLSRSSNEWRGVPPSSNRASLERNAQSVSALQTSCAPPMPSHFYLG